MPAPTHPSAIARRRAGRLVGIAGLAACVAFGAAGPAAATARASAPGGTLSARDTSAPSGTINGAGASSAQPFFGRVFYNYHQANSKLTVNYAPSGSAVGISDIEQGTVDFGQTEIPMGATDLAKAKGPILQVPVDLGGVAVSYHVSGVSGGLHLDGPTLASIFLGKITKWNDAAIAALNHGKHLPNEPIIAVHRADSSGPGYDLDQYLIDTAPAWATTIGTTKASKTWPAPNVGVGEQLNSGVATYIAQTEGAIGFVEYAYARQVKFTNAALLSKSGTWVQPSITTIAKAGAAASSLSATAFNIIWGAGSQTYPLANFSWTLLDQTQANTGTGIALGKLFNWVVTTGQKSAAALGYAPLPKNVVTLSQHTLLGLQTSTGTAIFSS